MTLFFLQGAPNVADHNVLATQITVGALSVAFLNWLKGSKYFPWLTQETAKLNRVFAALVALIGAVGVHLTWAAGDTSGTYMITVTGATLHGIAMGGWVWLKQFVMQELIYRSTANGGGGNIPGGIGKASAPAAPAGK